MIIALKFKLSYVSLTLNYIFSYALIIQNSLVCSNIINKNEIPILFILIAFAHSL